MKILLLIGGKKLKFFNTNDQNRTPIIYEVIRKIGRGRYSEVFEGVNVANSQKCAIKVLKQSIFLLIFDYFILYS